MSRICFFRLGATPLFVRECTDVFGGAEVRAFTFARALAARGNHEIAFAMRADERLPQSRDGVSVVSISNRPKGFAKLVGSVRKRLSGQPVPFAPIANLEADVICCFGVHDPTANVISAARSGGKRSVLFLTSSEDVNDDVRGSAKKRRETHQHHYAIRHADQIIVQTEFQQRELLARFDRESVLVRNPIDTSIAAEDLRQPRVHVLWVGRADSDSKRADICFELARHLPNVPFRIVMNDDCRQLGEQLRRDLPANVTLERQVPLEEIESRFASATVLINTSDSEGFPNAFLQAAKYATPILSLNVDPDGMLTRKGCGEVAGTVGRMVELIPEYHARTPRVAAKAADARRYVECFHEIADRAVELELALEFELERMAA